jgi:hypothetical protein
MRETGLIKLRDGAQLVINFQYCKPPTLALQDEAANIFARRDEGVRVQRGAISFFGWQPVSNKCHDNAILAAKSDQTYVRIYGWLNMGMIEAKVVRFASHSVVRNIDGRLIDITPTTTGFPLFPFIRSTMTETEYDLAVSDLVRVFGASSCLDHLSEEN